MAGKTRPGRTSAGVAFIAYSSRTTVVHWEAMVEAGWQPGLRVMTHGALPLEVICRTVLDMTSLAIGSASNRVIKAGWFPGLCAVAGRALPLIVIRWTVLSMARLAVCHPGNTVVETGWFPGIRTVTG